MKANCDPIICEAIRAVGRVSELARACGVKPQSLYRWRQIPAARVLAVEAATGIPRERLRPDLYDAPRPRKRQPSHAAA